MASVGNSTCARFDNVARVGAHYQQELPFLFVKGTWLPSEFTVSICDGNDAWTGRATKDFVSKNARKLSMTESDYVDSIQYYFSKQQPNVRYELKWSKDSSPDLLCSKIMPHELILRLETTADSGPGVATDMVQFLLDAHYHINEELAKTTRTYERALAAKEVALTSLSKRLEQGKGSLEDRTNGHVPVEPDTALTTAGGTSSRGKRKAGAETGSRKRAQAVKTSEALPLFQRPPSIPVLDSYEEHVLASRPPPLSALGYKQQKAEERESSKEPSWLEKIDPNDNGATDDSNSDAQPLASRKAFLDRLSDVAVMNEDVTPVAKKGSGKKQGKSGGKSGGKASKKPLPISKISSEDSLDQVEEVVEKGITWADSVPPEASGPLTAPAPAKRKTPATAKKQSKSSAKPKKQSSSRSKKKAKPVDSETEASDEEPDEAPEQPGLPVPDEDRAITVQNAEFHDFDESRSSETAFVPGQFWALYDDQDGMPRFYGRIISVQNEPSKETNPSTKRTFQVSVEWLEPYKPTVPANGLVKTAKLSAACGEFTFGTKCIQDVPAFSHVVQVSIDPSKAVVTFWPSEGELWALYRHWEKKQQAKREADEDYYYEYDLVKVLSKLSSTDGVTVVPLLKVGGFKSLFTVADLGLSFTIPYKQIQARFSHSIPKHEMLGSESPGVPIGAWELDPASTPQEYLNKGSLEQDGVL